jgi:transcriptional regulator with XRE-family HTH domain
MIQDNIKKYRERAGLSQKALADRLGVNQSLIARYEIGIGSRPPADTVKAIADALGVTPNDMFA